MASMTDLKHRYVSIHDVLMIRTLMNKRVLLPDTEAAWIAALECFSVSAARPLDIVDRARVHVAANTDDHDGGRA